MMNRRVVVTGLGMVTPIGNDVATSWKSALEGKSGIDRIQSFDASAFGSQIAGEVKDFDPSKYLGVKEVRRFDRFVHFGWPLVSWRSKILVWKLRTNSRLKLVVRLVLVSVACRSFVPTTRPTTNVVRVVFRPS